VQGEICTHPAPTKRLCVPLDLLTPAPEGARVQSVRLSVLSAQTLKLEASID
jgi:hypothetical protein